MKTFVGWRRVMAGGVACYLCVGRPGPSGCCRCGGTGVDPGFIGRFAAVGLAAAPAVGGLPAGVPSGALVAAAVIGLLLFRRRQMVIAAVVLVLGAALAGLLPDDGAGGPLGPNAAVPAAYRPWVAKAGHRCAEVSAALLAAQLRQESGFDPRAQSPAGAQGVAQFMPGTWASWAVDANGNGIASPWDPPDAITAQGSFMCSLAGAVRDGIAAGRLHGDTLDLTLAGYNAGLGAVLSAGGLPPYPETRNYVRSITAATASFTAG